MLILLFKRMLPEMKICKHENIFAVEHPGEKIPSFKETNFKKAIFILHFWKTCSFPHHLETTLQQEQSRH